MIFGWTVFLNVVYDGWRSELDVDVYATVLRYLTLGLNELVYYQFHSDFAFAASLIRY